jgi:hypothetical protein
MVDEGLGLIPGIGDGFGAVVPLLLLRLWGIGVASAGFLGNTLVDFALGPIPIVGDLFDIGFKANGSRVPFIHGSGAHC